MIYLKSRRINVEAVGREGVVACQLAGRKEVRGAVRWRVVCWTRRREPAARMSRDGGLVWMARQHSCESSTCIAKRVLSRLAWNSLLPRFVSRSSPKSNFINL